MNSGILFLFLIFICACTKTENSQVAVAPVALSTEQLKTRGQAVYATSCTACHNIDPAKDGTIGPALSGSSLELLSARLLRAEYPTGYLPKRNTKAMVAMPHLEKELPALFEFLK